jgi:hypothetical protein
VNTESPQRDPSTESESTRRRTWATGSALLITNLTKVTGVVIAVLEWARPGEAQDSVLALCAVFVVGAEALERILLDAIDRVLGRGE